MSEKSQETRSQEARPLRPRICIVSPCFDEEEVIARFYEETKRVLQQSCGDCSHELIFVDDGSRDGTLARLNAIAARDPCVTVFSLTRNFGHQVALTAGLDHASGDAVIVMDSDLQHPPELIPEMIRLWREGNDVVAAVRKFTRGASAFKNVTSLGFYALFNFLSETRISAGSADFCLLSRRALEAVSRMPERHRFLRGMIAWIGFPRVELPYEAASRAAGRSKYTVGKMMRLALDALFAFTGEPVRFTARVGMFVMACGFLYLLYVVLTTLFVGGTDKGWPSLICTVLILGGLQLFCIGLLGEYLVRVYEEAKGRPLYLFKQTPRRGERSADGLRARATDELERSSSAHDP